MAIRGREAHVAKLGPAAAVILREGRMYELPPPPAVDEEDPRVRQRRVAATLGEALEITPYTWKGELAPGDQMALVSRNLAQVVGVDELKQPWPRCARPPRSSTWSGSSRSAAAPAPTGSWPSRYLELPATATTRQLEPVRPAEPLAGLPDQSPVPLADAIGRFLHRMGDAIDGAAGGAGPGDPVRLQLRCSPSCRAAGRDYPRQILRTAAVEEGRRRRLGCWAWPAWRCCWPFGTSVASLPAVSPTEAIPRAAVARAGDRGDASP